MKKTSASITLALLLDLLFILLFSFILFTFRNTTSLQSLHMNQVGMFKEESNVSKCIETLKEIGIEAFSYQNDDLMIVITSINLDEEITKDEQKLLKENNISYIQKKIDTKNSSLIQAVKEKNIVNIVKEMNK